MKVLFIKCQGGATKPIPGVRGSSYRRIACARDLAPTMKSKMPNNYGLFHLDGARALPTRMELLSFPDVTDEEDQNISRLLSYLKTVPITAAVEEAAISVRRETRPKLPDAIIAATAMTQDALLVTADTDFNKVPNISVLHPNSL